MENKQISSFVDAKTSFKQVSEESPSMIGSMHKFVKEMQLPFNTLSIRSFRSREMNPTTPYCIPSSPFHSAQREKSRCERTDGKQRQLGEKRPNSQRFQTIEESLGSKEKDASLLP